MSTPRVATLFHCLWLGVPSAWSAFTCVLLEACQIDPGNYRDLDKVAKALRGTVEVLQLAVRLDGESSLMENMANVTVAEAAPTEAKKAALNASKDEGFTTATAPGVTFASRVEMREHMKSDWHKFNLKRRTQGQDMLSYEQFQEACVDGDFFAA